ncbi:MAG: hypothetical protein DME24_17010 [Verrucomicrobia bacterium]|nr:MAG: hypothetical protein DME24_17010 [Verrucomicrobiota bacterium]
MNKRTKIALYVLLALSACLFIWRFQSNYARLMKEGETKTDTDLVNIKVPDYQRMAAPAKTDYHLGGWGAGMVLSLVGLGLMVAHDISGLVGGRALKVIYNDEGEGMANPDYEKAEEKWANGNFLEAIQLMRDYLKQNPREQHVALRIAEIYEKDLQNFLAAALEYEEVLKQKLPPERWGWAAIHLCNLYTSKLNQSDKAIALLQRIVADYGATGAAEKARKRLAQLEDEGVALPSAEPPPAPAAPASNLPPGFAPKK